jgi:hypothetical protein
MAVLDALVDIAPCCARVWTLTPQAHLWVETHVTVQQVRTWSEGILEVASYDITDLLMGMLRAGLYITPMGGWISKSTSRLQKNVHMAHVSTN